MKLKDNDTDFRTISIDDFVETFDCGNTSINTYLKRNALFDTLERNGTTTLVFDKLTLIGFFTLFRQYLPQLDTDVMIVQYLGVEDTKQDTGIGSKILEFIAEVSKITNERYVFLEALKDDELELINWYRKRGFILLDPDQIEDVNDHRVWLFLDLLDQESLEKLFYDP